MHAPHPHAVVQRAFDAHAPNHLVTAHVLNGVLRLLAHLRHVADATPPTHVCRFALAAGVYTRTSQSLTVSWLKVRRTRASSGSHPTQAS